MVNWTEPRRRERAAAERHDRNHERRQELEIERIESAITELNRAALEYGEIEFHQQHDTHLRVWKVCQNPSGSWSIIWRITVGEDGTFFQFTNHPHNHDSLEDAVRHNLEELQERIDMNIFGTKLFPYLQGEMLKGKRVSMTIKSVVLKELSNSRTTDEKPIVYFRERDKGLVLNKTNARAIAELYGPETDDWIGQKIYLYAERGEWFGKAGWAIRVPTEYPDNGQPAKPRPPQTVEELPFGDLGDEPEEEEINDLNLALTAESLNSFIAHAYNVVPGYENPKVMEDYLTETYVANNGLDRFAFGKTKTGEYLQILADRPEPAEEGNDGS